MNPDILEDSTKFIRDMSTDIRETMNSLIDLIEKSDNLNQIMLREDIIKLEIAKKIIESTFLYNN